MGELSQTSYYNYARQGQLYSALALVTTPVIYSTATGTGGPLLWNGSGKAIGGNDGVLAILLAVGVGITTASGVASTLGITGGTGQTSAPSSTTAIDAGPVNMLIGSGGAASCTAYRKGTVTNAGNFFQPTHTLDTGAVTVSNVALSWVDLHGSIVVPPGSWAAVAAGATATSAVLQIGLLWAEVPI